MIGACFPSVSVFRSLQWLIFVTEAKVKIDSTLLVISEILGKIIVIFLCGMKGLPSRKGKRGIKIAMNDKIKNVDNLV
jgi:hypothetical protein